MARFFNTAGPCRPELHYMLPPERRLPQVRGLIDAESYFVIHAARQVGKTTCFRTLARHLTAEGRYVAVHSSCEMGQAARNDLEAGVSMVLASLQGHAADQLPADVHPLSPISPCTRARVSAICSDDGARGSTNPWCGSPTRSTHCTTMCSSACCGSCATAT